MKLAAVCGIKNMRDNKFSYPRVNRNKRKSLPQMNSNDENDPFYFDKENIRPNDFWHDCQRIRDESNLFSGYSDMKYADPTLNTLNKNNVHNINICYDLIVSGKKDYSEQNNYFQLGTPGFLLDKFDKAETSSMKKNKNGSNSKVAENRYAEEVTHKEENEFDKYSNNKVHSEFGAYEKVTKKNNATKGFGPTGFGDIINQKLDFEMIQDKQNIYSDGKQAIDNAEKENFERKILAAKLLTNEPRQRLHLLYEKGKIKNEVNRLLFQKNEEIKLQAELNECTFQPKINKRKPIREKNNVDANFYERLASWKNKIDKKNKKIEKEPKDDKDCTYQPFITEKNLENVLYRQSILNDPNSRTYLIRQEKARQENEEKKNRVYWSSKTAYTKINSHYGNLVSNTTANTSIIQTTKDENTSILNGEEMNKNLSQLNLNSFKKTLRNELSNIDGLYINTESDQD